MCWWFFLSYCWLGSFIFLCRSNGGMMSAYGGSQDDWAYSIVLTKDIGLAMAGFTKSYGAGGSDMWLIRTVLKTVPWGNVTTAFQANAWNKTYGGPQDDVAKQVIQASDGGFALAGYTNSSGAGGLDMWLVKTDVNGDAVWNVTFGGPQDDVANSIAQNSDGGYVLAGYTCSSGPEAMTWIVKTDSNGVIQWSQTYAGQGANSVVQSGDGGIVFAVDFPGAFGLMKIDTSGNLLWSQSFAALWSLASAQSVIQTSDGGYALAGWMLDNDTGTKAAWLIKTDASGIKLWDQIIEGVRVYSVIQTAAGGYAMAGDYASLIITNSFGNVQWNQPNDSLSDDVRANTFTGAYCVIEASPLHFVMAGAQASYGQIPHGYTALLLAINLISDTTPPTIRILAPQNSKTYAPDNVPLTIYADSSTVRLWYAIDGQGNFTLTGNMTLPTLTDGAHQLTLYGQDEAYNTASSEPAYFLTQTIYFNVSANVEPSIPDLTPTANPTENSGATGTEPFPLPWMIIVVVCAVAVGTALALYVRKDISSS
jgi:hypothetical protein